jgi:predicted transcriptional regulator
LDQNSTDGIEPIRYHTSEMSTVQEIRTAIAQLKPREQALLTAELLATLPEPETQAVEEALTRGMADVTAGRVRPISEVPALIRQWLGKS